MPTPVLIHSPALDGAVCLPVEFRQPLLYPNTRIPGHSSEWSGAMRTSVENWAHDYALSHPGTDYIVLGHHHVVVNEPVSAECRLVILGDWINHDSYAAFNDGKLSIHFFSQEQ